MVKGEGDSGLVGVVLFCPFLFASIYHAILANHRLQNIQNPKVLFYISLSLYALLELIYFAGLFYYHQLIPPSSNSLPIVSLNLLIFLEAQDGLSVVTSLPYVYMSTHFPL
jgi:hypothetical protein